MENYFTTERMVMEMKYAVTVTVTCRELTELADCGRRMTRYADPDGPRLISVLSGSGDTPVRLELDRQCIEKQSQFIAKEVFPCSQKR